MPSSRRCWPRASRRDSACRARATSQSSRGCAGSGRASGWSSPATSPAPPSRPRRTESSPGSPAAVFVTRGPGRNERGDRGPHRHAGLDPPAPSRRSRADPREGAGGVPGDRLPPESYAPIAKALPVKVVLGDNGAYGTIAMHQHKRIGPDALFGVHLRSPDFAAVARAYGVVAFVVQKTAEFADAFEAALAHPGPRSSTSRRTCGTSRRRVRSPPERSALPREWLAEGRSHGPRLVGDRKPAEAHLGLTVERPDPRLREQLGEGRLPADERRDRRLRQEDDEAFADGGVGPLWLDPGQDEAVAPDARIGVNGPRGRRVA